MTVEHLAAALQDLRAKNLHRTLRILSSAPGARVMIGGREFVNFASNDYLGLASDDRVRRAAADAALKWGAGAGSSRLLGGTLEIHERLEAELAALKGTEAAAVFASGYHANTGLLPALAGPEDTILLDRLAHASLVDGARLSRAALRVFRHNDAADLEKVLKRRPARGRCWIATESVFSMDGDAAPLADIVGLAERHGAFTYVDEAHAAGVRGADGGGLVKALGLARRVDVCMGTLSKALGSLGGFACGSRTLIEWIHNRCRSFIYSTALPPASAAAALAALEIVRGEPERRARLDAVSARFRAALSVPGEGPIVPFVVGGAAETLALSKRLWDAGIYAPAVRPPTVPKGTSRLRFSLTAGHSEADADRAAEILLRAEKTT